MNKIFDITKVLANPKNPRKEIAENEEFLELVESIRENGILQTPVGFENADGTVTLLMGHRRLAAAKKAGLTELEVKLVTEPPISEQVALMVSENTKREDLTVAEEAEAIQLMLDLGETVDTVAKKLGIKKSQVKHRAKVASLSREALNKDRSFQLSFEMLALLEDVKSAERKTDILNNALNEANFKQLVKSNIKAEDQERFTKEAENALTTLGYKLDANLSWSWNPGHERVYSIQPIPYEEGKKFVMPEGLTTAKGEVFFNPVKDYSNAINFWTVKKTDEEAKAAKDAKEAAEKAAAKLKKQIKAKTKELRLRIADLLRTIVKGEVGIMDVIGTEDKKLKKEREAKLLEMAFELLNMTGSVSVSNGTTFTYGSNSWETDAHEKDKVKFAKLSMANQMLASSGYSIENDMYASLGKEDNKHNAVYAVRLKKAAEIIEYFGMLLDTEEYALIEGDSELYVKGEPKKDAAK